MSAGCPSYLSVLRNRLRLWFFIITVVDVDFGYHELGVGVVVVKSSVCPLCVCFVIVNILKR